uniref:Uncharacterized protein n=1 Tax=Heterorhabditis bacteriophora TaxID=37862 RepID=A0A1I7WZF7_HETBA
MWMNHPSSIMLYLRKRPNEVEDSLIDRTTSTLTRDFTNPINCRVGKDAAANKQRQHNGRRIREHYDTTTTLHVVRLKRQLRHWTS